MAIDTSIYSSIQPTKLDIPSYADNYQKALTLRQLGMQNQQMETQMADQQAMKEAYAQNTGADGKLNQRGFLSSIGRINPKAALEYQKNFSEMSKQQAETQKVQIEAAQQKAGVVASALDYLAGMTNPQDRANAYGKVRQQLIGQDVITPQDAPEQYDENWFRQTHDLSKRSAPYLNNQKTAVETQKAQGEIAMQPLEADVKRAQIRHLNAESDKTKNDKVPNQTQFAAATYGTRAKQAEDVFAELAAKNFDPTTNQSSLTRMLPDFMEGLKGENIKRQEQAERNFVNAILRRESGAAISKDEFANAGSQYFPRNGDTPEVLKQKEQNRKTAMAALEAEGAPASSRLAQSMSGITIGSSVPTQKLSGSDLIQSANAGQKKPGISAQDASALQWLKTADKSDPVVFQVRAKLKAKGLIK